MEDLDLEPGNDFVLVRDGAEPDSPRLRRLSGRKEDNPQFVVSTGNKLYLYTRTDQADSRLGYRIKYFTGCSVTINRWRIYNSYTIYDTIYDIYNIYITEPTAP